MELAQRIAALRKERGLSQMEVAQALDVSRQAVSRWEVGAAVPSTENLRMLSKLYQVSFDYLVQGTEPSQPEQPQPLEQQKMTRRERILLALLMLTLALFLVVLAQNGQRRGEIQDVPPYGTWAVEPHSDAGYETVVFSFDR